MSFAALALAPLGLGCGGGQASSSSGGTTTQTPTFDYPMDGELRLQHIQAKGTHNSYHVAVKGTIDPLNYTHAPLDVQLASQGVRQIELDVHDNLFKKRFDVYHEEFDKETTCPTLVACLTLVKTWSDAHPAHQPVFIQIETKDSTTQDKAEDYFGRLEGEVLSVFPRERVISPDDVRGSAASVREAVTTKGWPTLGEARGKVLFFIDDGSELRTYYTHGKKDLEGRLMFIDADPTDPWAGILLANDPTTDAARLDAAVSAGLLVRTRADADNNEPLAGDTARRDKAFASGAQFVSTDYPVKVEGVNYVVEVPDGKPSRCNPKTAPKECTSEAIENPAFMSP